MQGKIIKGIGGFYTVHDGAQTVLTCRAKGIFRNRGEKPLVGDNCEFSRIEEEEGTGRIDKLLPRKNELIRPAVANMDQALILVSAGKPAFHPLLLDNFLLWMGMQGVPTLIGIGKCDQDPDEAARIAAQYAGTGYPVLIFSALTGEGVPEPVLGGGGIPPVIPKSFSWKKTALSWIPRALPLWIPRNWKSLRSAASIRNSPKRLGTAVSRTVCMTGSRTAV